MLRRPRLQGDTLPLPVAPLVDIEVIHVTRLECVLDTGLPLAFDLEDGQTYTHDDLWLTVHLGTRTIRIAANRILYTDTRPSQMSRVRVETA